MFLIYCYWFHPRRPLLASSASFAWTLIFSYIWVRHFSIFALLTRLDRFARLGKLDMTCCCLSRPLPHSRMTTRFFVGCSRLLLTCPRSTCLRLTCLRLTCRHSSIARRIVQTHEFCSWKLKRGRKWVRIFGIRLWFCRRRCQFNRGAWS